MFKAFAVHHFARYSNWKNKMSSLPCIFCKISNSEETSNLLYQDDLVTAFRDIHPVAPTHILVIPNQHITSLNEIQTQDEPLVGHMYKVAQQLAVSEGIDRNGYRITMNTGPDGGQTIFHLHLHLIGGQRMRYPIG